MLTLGLFGGQGSFHGGNDGGVVGLHAVGEAADEFAVAADQEFFEVPGDVDVFAIDVLYGEVEGGGTRCGRGGGGFILAEAGSDHGQTDGSGGERQNNKGTFHEGGSI